MAVVGGGGWTRWLVLVWVGSLHDFAWGQVSENRRVAGGKLAGFLRSLYSVRIVISVLGEKRAGVGRAQWQEIQEFQKQQQLDTRVPSGEDPRAGKWLLWFVN